MPTRPTSAGRGPYLADLFGGVGAVFLERSVRVISDQGHGGALWIVRDPSALANSGVRIGVRVNDVGPALLDRKYDERVRWLETIGHLGGIDGAVVLDGSARLLGFGAFIPTPGDALVFRYHKDKGPTMSSASTIGGGRHRSAIQFCAACAPAAAYVVSEDGRISFFASDRPNSIPLCAEIVSLGVPSIL